MNGHFQFDAVPGGRIVLVAQKPGFFRAEMPEFFWPPQADAGDRSGPTKIVLAPEAVIYGHVEDARGEPIPNAGAHFRILSNTILEGRRMLRDVARGETNEDGNFRVPGLRPGAYYVAMEANWCTPQTFATHFPVKPNLKTVPYCDYGGEVYRGMYSALTYFPGKPDLASASPVVLAPGQRMRVDFSFRTELMFPVSIKVEPKTSDAWAALVTLLNKDGQPLSISPKYQTEDSTFRGMLPPGDYVLRASNNYGGVLWGSETPLHVASAMPDVQVFLQPLVEIPVVVHTELTKTIESGNPPPQRVIDLELLTTRPHDPFASYHPELPSSYKNRLTIHSDDGDFSPKTIHIHPGKYRIDFAANLSGSFLYAAVEAGGYPYVQSARSGTIDLLRQELAVLPEQKLPPIEIVVRDDSGTVAGTVQPTNVTRATALIVSRWAPMRPRVQHLFTDSQFVFLGLPEGDYTVFVFDSLDNIEYTDPAALKKYESKAANVTIAPRQKVNVTLDLIKTGE
jgi:hypothetical protein